MSQLKVNGIRNTSATSDAITLATDGTCTVKATNRSSNLIINGSCIVAQRSQSSTSAGYQTLDRWTSSMAGTDEACTFAQADVTAGTDPWNAGFRKAFKVTNGNQTSGAGAADDVSISQNIEAQNLSNSGWDYTSSSSYITLSFWAKSSVAQTFYSGIRIYGDDQREYCFSYTLAANTWKKVTHSIPGGSGHTILNTNALGAFVQWPLWWGTNYTSSGRAVDTWQIKNNAANYPDNTSTWYTTNDATFELTGVQLEVSDHATEFEFRSYGDELARCQRYYYEAPDLSHRIADGLIACNATGSYALPVGGAHPTTMRAAPTLTLDSVTYSGCSFNSSNTNTTAWGMRVTTDNTTHFRITTGSATFDAEL
tara:strand:- start:199 stop:1302 length:1104 start_codon:yes stop_codon:yes gene_type:complete